MEPAAPSVAAALLLLALLASAASAACTTCHHEGAVLHPPSPHSIRLGGGHATLNCLECHEPPDMGTAPPVKLCRRCHPLIVGDYEEYLHGGYMVDCREGGLAGTYLGYYRFPNLICPRSEGVTHRPCLSCHNPHDPAYVPPRPMPPPPSPAKRPWGVVAAGLAALLSAAPIALLLAWRRG